MVRDPEGRDRNREWGAVAAIKVKAAAVRAEDKVPARATARAAVRAAVRDVVRAAEAGGQKPKNLESQDAKYAKKIILRFTLCALGVLSVAGG